MGNILKWGQNEQQFWGTKEIGNQKYIAINPLEAGDSISIEYDNRQQGKRNTPFINIKTFEATAGALQDFHGAKVTLTRKEDGGLVVQSNNTVFPVIVFSQTKIASRRIDEHSKDRSVVVKEGESVCIIIKLPNTQYPIIQLEPSGSGFQWTVKYVQSEIYDNYTRQKRRINYVKSLAE